MKKGKWIKRKWGKERAIWGKKDGKRFEGIQVELKK